MKASGADQAAVGVVPAQQRLHGDDRSVAQLDDRLVVELELLSLDRAPQVVLDLHVLDHAGAHHLVEDLVAAAAALLGAVEGRIGVPDQGLRRLAAPADRDSDAGADEVLAVAQDEGPRERLRDPLGDAGGATLVPDVLGEDRELVPAEARDRVSRAQRLLDPGGDGGEELVAGGVAEAVVDELELVEVEEEHRDRGLAPGGHREGVLEPIEEEVAVGQAGEGIMEGLVLGALLAASPLDRVGEDVRDRLHEVDVLLREVGAAHGRPRRSPRTGRPLPLIRITAALLTPICFCSSDCWKRCSLSSRHDGGLTGGQRVARTGSGGRRARLPFRSAPPRCRRLATRRSSSPPAIGLKTTPYSISSTSATIRRRLAGRARRSRLPRWRAGRSARPPSAGDALEPARLLAARQCGRRLRECVALPCLVACLPGAHQADADHREQPESVKGKPAPDREGDDGEGRQVGKSDQPRSSEADTRGRQTGRGGPAAACTGCPIRHRARRWSRSAGCRRSTSRRRRARSSGCGRSARPAAPRSDGTLSRPSDGRGEDQIAVGLAPGVEGVDGAAEADDDREPEADSDRGEPALDFLLGNVAGSRRRSLPLMLEAPSAMAPIACPGSGAASSALSGRY